MINCAVQVRPVVAQPRHHQRAFAGRNQHRGDDLAADKRLQLPAYDPIGHNLPDEQMQRFQPLLHLGLQRRVQIIRFYRSVQDGAAARQRRWFQQRQKRQADGMKLVNRPLLCRQRRLHLADAALHGVIKGGQHDRFLAFKVAVDAALLHACNVDKVRHRRARIAPHVEQRG